MRRVGHRVAAPRAVAQDELDVLAGAVLQGVVRRQLQPHDGDVGRRPRRSRSTRLGSLRIANSPAPGTVRASRTMSLCGAAWQVRIRPAASSSALSAFLLMRAVDDASLEHPALARAAGAVAAAVRQADALADGGVQDRLVAVDAEGLAARLDGDGEGHGWTGGGVRRLDSAAILPACGVPAEAPARRADPSPPCRPTDAFQETGAADRRLRRHRPARGAPPCRPLARARADVDSARIAGLRAAGIRPLRGDLDERRALARLAGLADAVLHLAPPPASGSRDPRTRNLVAALARSRRARRLVYASTTGVYGDRAGAPIDETRRAAPATERARRRVDAEAPAAPVSGAPPASP